MDKEKLDKDGVDSISFLLVGLGIFLKYELEIRSNLVMWVILLWILCIITE